MSSKVHFIKEKGFPELEEFLSQYKIVVVRVSADWCAPCQQTEGQYHNLSERLDLPKLVKLVMVDSDDKCSDQGHTWGEVLQANSIPMFKIFIDGKDSFTSFSGDIIPVEKFIEEAYESMRGKTFV